MNQDNQSQNHQLYQEWLNKVKEDEDTGKKILEGRGFPAPACFHFQQMAEKSLKALLIFYNVEFPKIHDLIVLAMLFEPILPEIKEYKTELNFLNNYYIETRYPGDYPEFTLKEAQEAFEAAVKIKEFVLEKIAKGRQ